MSFENAEQNLKEFGKDLKLEGLAFDENKTCILGIDNAFSLHLTYEPNSDRLYLYSPVLDGLPKDQKTLLLLYSTLLEGSMLGGQMAGGGIGVAPKEELILIHAVLEMGASADASLLSRFAPLFVEVVEQWRGIAGKIINGSFDKERDMPKFPGAPGGRPGAAARPVGSGPVQGQGQGGSPNTDTGRKPGDSYIKI